MHMKKIRVSERLTARHGVLSESTAYSFEAIRDRNRRGGGEYSRMSVRSE